ncbi:MAG: TatD family hydrolase [Peptococcaceae bacterium]|nr:TatD family hydrolase [Peptococcaceae bacterium]
MILVDTHAHIDIEDFDGDREEVLGRAAESGVAAIINASFDLESSRRSAAMAGRYRGLYALVGIHPHDAGGVPEGYLEDLRLLAKNPAVLALGEMGLDYYRDLSPRPVQQRVFREQLDLARELDMPVVIHDRDAHGEVLNILKRDGAPRRGGIMHCYSGSWEMARECMKMGFYISIAGPVTYPNAVRLKDIASRIPLDRILVETDCPYLAPQVRRGKRNEPAYVRYVAEEIARLRGMAPADFALAASANAARIFGLNIPGL